MKGDPIQIVKAEYLRRRKRNSRYSLRSFSRDLGIDQGLLCNILNRKRSFTEKQKVKIANACDLTPQDKAILIGTKISYRKPHYSFQEFDAEFDLSWLDVVVMDFVEVSGFKSDIRWIAKRLSVAEPAVLESLERLQLRGLVSISSEKIRKTRKKLVFDPKKSQKFVRHYHQVMSQKATLELGRTDDKAFSEQDFRGMTMGINPERLPEAREKLKKFVEEMGDLLIDGDCTRLYQFNLQLFPLSK